MEVVSSVADLRTARARLSEPVGLVPTMGYLHEGHLSLARQARSENEGSIATIFVNPTQFDPHEDIAQYPSDLQRDLELLAGEGMDLIFAPPVEEVYRPDFRTYVVVEGITGRLEGASRPHHFRGVATVLCKIFNLTKPNRAYFGEKDAQQLRVIRQMVRDLDFDLEIVPCPTVREPDGLAMSSRNAYLNPEERRAATVLHRALTSARKSLAQGERDADKLRTAMHAVLDGEPLAQVDYVSVADPDSLQELARVEARALASLAVLIGSTRLIDNVILA